MTDRFAERVAEVAGDTAEKLREVDDHLLHSIALVRDLYHALKAWDIEGWDSAVLAAINANEKHRETLAELIRAHEEVTVDCHEDTPPYGISMHDRTPPGATKPTDR